MGKSKGAGEYPTTTLNTGLYGSSTTNKNGTTFNPSSFQQNLVGSVEGYVPNILNEYVNPSYNSEMYLAEKAQRQNQQKQAYDSGVLSQLANRGLMRSSGLQSATNSFADTLANQEVQAMQNYQAQQANKLATLMGLYEVPYNMMHNSTNASKSLSDAVGNYNLQNQAFIEKQKAQNSATFGELGNIAGGLAGTLIAGPAGGAIGSRLGQTLGSYAGNF